MHVPHFNPFSLTSAPYGQAGLRQCDVVVGLIQPDLRSCYDPARQLARPHGRKGFVKFPFLAVKQAMVYVVFLALPTDLHRRIARLKGYVRYTGSPAQSRLHPAGLRGASLCFEALSFSQCAQYLRTRGYRGLA
jgi:hypothetical protein